MPRDAGRSPEFNLGAIRPARCLPVHTQCLTVFPRHTAVSHRSGSAITDQDHPVSRSLRSLSRGPGDTGADAPRPPPRRAPCGRKIDTSSVRRRSHTAASPRAAARALPKKDAPSACKRARRRPSADARRAAREARAHTQATVAPLAHEPCRGARARRAGEELR